MSGVLLNFRCPTCGCVEIEEYGSYIKCKACGNKYRRKLQEEPIYADLSYAVNERQEAEFDKSRRRYDALIQEYKHSDCGMEEAWWGRFLCEQYVIFYQNEKEEAIPSFWNINDEPCTKSESYKKALQYARNSGNESNYERLAELIEEYKEKYRRVLKERPEGNDIFICFKDSGTNDANLGYKIYNKFSGKYNIFFSRESLNNIQCNDYEPYIYHALKTAKSMIVICSDRDNLESKWVHNEWWRFWKFAQSGEKTIIPVCRRGFNPAQLPDELSRCQAHKEDIDLLSVLSDRLDTIFKNEDLGNAPLTSFGKQLNIVEAMFEAGEVDNANIQILELLKESAGRPYDHISALLLQAKIFSNNYRRLKNAQAKASIAHAEELAKTHNVAIEDMPEYQNYRAAVVRKRVKRGCIALLLMMLLGLGAFMGWYASQDTTVKELSNSKYSATITATEIGFENGTEFQIAEVQGSNQIKSMIRTLAINQNTYRLYEMELWHGGKEVAVNGTVTVTIPLPSGIAAERAVVYYMSGDTPEKISAKVSKGNISFTTDHFSVYMIAEEKSDCNHIAITDPEVRPTCTESGLTEGQHCSLCKEVLVEQEVVVALGHAPGSAATCTEGQYCTVCHTKLASALGHKAGAEATCVDAQKCIVCRTELVPARGHKPGAVANCTDGQKCSVCRVELVPASGHTPSNEPTCTDGQYCTVCRAELASAKGHTVGENATCTTSQVCTDCGTELAAALGHIPGPEANCEDAQICTVCGDELMAALGHDYRTALTAPTCTEEGYTTYTCACGDSYVSDRLAALGHTPGAEATCTRAQKCTVCNAELIAALGHTPGETTCTTSQNCTVCGVELESVKGHIPSAAATCTEPQICMVCQLVLAPATGHNHIPVVTAPTCTEDGYTAHICACGDSYTDAPVDALGHTEGAAATCTEPQICTVCHAELMVPLGHTEGEAATCTTAQICTVCNAELTAALGHTEGEAATCTTAQTCTVCGDELVEALGHHVENWLIDRELSSGTPGLKSGECSVCGETVQMEFIYSEGLSYSLNSDGTYTVTGIGSYSGTILIIPPVYEGASVTKIAEYAFQNLNFITKIVVPDSVTEIGVGAFYGCNALEEITLPFVGISENATGKNSVFGVIFDYNDSYGSATYSSRDNDGSIEYVNVQYGSSQNGGIWQYSCAGTYSHREMVYQTHPQTPYYLYVYYYTSYYYFIPDTLKSVTITSQELVPIAAFKGCYMIEIITLPETLTSIGDYAFQDCSSLNSISGGMDGECSIPQGVITISQYAFQNCSSFTKLDLAAVTVVEDYAFNGCSNFVEVTGGELTSIGAYAFYMCMNLSEVPFNEGSSIEIIPQYAFAQCHSLQMLTLPNALKTIEQYAFYGCVSIKEVWISPNTTNMGNYSFADCGAIQKINSYSLGELILPEGLKSVGSYAFKNLVEMRKIIVPSTVTWIGEGAFNGINNLVDITIPHIGETPNSNNSEISVFGYIFGYASDYIENITTQQWYSRYWTNYGYSHNYKYYYIPKTIVSVTVTEDKTIPFGAFFGCSFIQSINLPSKIETIDTYAFYHCTNLLRINSFTDGEFLLPNGLTHIGERSFAYCPNIQVIALDSTILEIYPDAFTGCNTISEVRYGGAIEENWNNVKIYQGNDRLTQAQIVYYRGTMTLSLVLNGIAWDSGEYKIAVIFDNGTEQEWVELISKDDKFVCDIPMGYEKSTFKFIRVVGDTLIEANIKHQTNTFTTLMNTNYKLTSWSAAEKY